LPSPCLWHAPSPEKHRAAKLNGAVHPTLLQLGHLTLPTFGLLAALGLMSALSLALRCAPLANLPPDTLWNATLFAAIAAFVLSRILLVAANLRGFLSSPFLLLTLPSLTGIGLLLTAVATLAYLRLKHIPIHNALDAWAAPATLLWAFLALGHLAEGSDPGLPSRAPWAVAVPPDPDLQQPVGLFAAIIALALTALLLRYLRRSHIPGNTAALALVFTGAAQFLLSFLRQPYPYAPDAPAFPLDPIQFLALAIIATACLLYLTTLPRQLPRHPIQRSPGTEPAPKEAL